MTDSTTPSAPVEQKKASAEKKIETTAPKIKQGGRSGMALGAIAIVLVIALGGGMYYHGHQQAASQQAIIQKLQSQIDELKTGQSQEKDRFATSVNQQSELLKSAEQKMAEQSDVLKAQESRLQELQTKITAISNSDTKIWRLSEADYLVKLAARKLWNEQDIPTAESLLKSADDSLAELRDPSLNEVRQAIIQDISAISTISQIDFDGIALKLNELSDQVMNLPSASTDWDNTPMDKESTEVSGELKDWRQNLEKSWHNFMSEFITIRSRDVPENELTSPLLTPDQDTYLRENLRLKLLIAARAVSRHQGDIYKQSLESVSTWVRAYFDPDHSSTKAFLEQLDDLSQESISFDLPKELKSLELLNKVTQSRMRNMVIQEPAPAPSATSNKEG
ncbi:uroporphyrinogen-III C-methyltransferase [Budvicia diplopodorum]|uniref:uroporphyrinogen-III C-methyltransferase n=1 Tax=Budvicia diplopodorum TaxID=1119056 RepID=UPI00135BFB10|nr:uroporphyrinogen-III C-methyltransferase [Budvicia diplopodorum]